MSEPTKTKRQLLDELEDAGDADSRRFARLRVAIEVQMAEDLEAAIHGAARAGDGLKRALFAVTAVGAVGTVVGAIAAFG